MQETRNSQAKAVFPGTLYLCQACDSSKIDKYYEKKAILYEYGDELTNTFNL